MKEEEMIEAKFTATVTAAKGTCHANHKVGSEVRIELLRFRRALWIFLPRYLPLPLRHAVWREISLVEKDTIDVECPDRYNTVSLKIERKK